MVVAAPERDTAAISRAVLFVCMRKRTDNEEAPELKPTAFDWTANAPVQRTQSCFRRAPKRKSTLEAGPPLRVWVRLKRAVSWPYGTKLLGIK